MKLLANAIDYVIHKTELTVNEIMTVEHVNSIPGRISCDDGDFFVGSEPDLT
jgi:hypothetical protein